jgi:hypothetical protein
VGDACDPHPGVAGDRIAYVDTLDMLSSRWTNLSGNWHTHPAVVDLMTRAKQ